MICNFLNIILVIVYLCIICIINKSYAIQRYNLCNISATPGIYEITSNCSLTSEITLTSTVSTDTLQVIGIGTTKPAIDGGWDSSSNAGIRLFSFASTSVSMSLIIENTILTHAKSNFGAALSNSGKSTLKNCIIERNYGSCGGAIWTYVGSLIMMNCIVSNNYASAGSGGCDGSGGGIHITSGSAVITNTIFSSNEARIGGAIFNQYGTATFNGCTFSGNKALGGLGGGAFHLTKTSTTTITNSVISNNAAYSGSSFTWGGAIKCYEPYSQGMTIILKSSKLENNANGKSAVENCRDSVTFYRINLEDNDLEDAAGGSLSSYYKFPTPSSCNDYSNSGYTCGLYMFCLDRSPNSLGISCLPSTLYPYIINVTSPNCVNSNHKHIRNCPTTGLTITIHGQHFVQLGNGIKSVIVGNFLCQYTLWTATKIICNIPPGIGANYLINITANNANSNTDTLQDPNKFSFSPPLITSYDPFPGTSQGGAMTAFTGSNFGTTESFITIQINGKACTHLTWVSNNKVYAKTPAGSGKDKEVIINVGNQNSSDSSLYAYKSPVINKVKPQLNGGLMILEGEEFANSSVTIVVKDRITLSEIVCDNPQRVSYTELRCTYNFPGDPWECQDKDVIVRIDTLESNLKQLCYTGDNGLIGTFTEKSATEGGVVSYNTRLVTLPSSNVLVKIIPSPPLRCSVTPSTLTFSRTSWDIDQLVLVEVKDDGIFLAKDYHSYDCSLTYTIESLDPLFSSLNDFKSKINVLSKGCGTGEFIGAYDRKNNGSECICSVRFFLPTGEECKDCPREKSFCNAMGLTAPPVAPGWWRYDHASDNIDQIPFYECPNKDACIGGNNTTNRCALGYNNYHPLCATCEKDYVLQQGYLCTACPGAYNNGNAIPAIELLISVAIAWFIGFAIFIIYFFSPSKTTRNLVGDAIDKIDTVGEKVEVLNNYNQIAIDSNDYLVKLKIFIGFAQCFSLFPFTFDIPWSNDVLKMMKYFELSSLDFFSLLGNTINCKMESHFLQSFQLHMILPLLILFALFLAYSITKCFRKHQKYTNITTTRLYTSAGLIIYTLYTGLSTRIFRLFKCQLIQGIYYLVADYRQICFEPNWNIYAIVAGVGGLIYVIGIPLVELSILYYNRKRLYKDEDLKERFGTFYLNYNSDSYYFDVLDLLRRLLLTGGLIMMGGESVAQTFLGIIVCAIWLLVLSYQKPYVNRSDNFLAILVSFQLMIILISGMALKLYSLTPNQDEYQQIGFSVMLIATTSIVTLISVIMTLANTPICNIKCVAYFKKQKKKDLRLEQTVDKIKSSESKLNFTDVGKEQKDISSHYVVNGDIDNEKEKKMICIEEMVALDVKEAIKTGKGELKIEHLE